jgi:hypothetical protein
MFGGTAEMILVVAVYAILMGMMGPSIQFAQSLVLGAVAAGEVRIIRDAAYAYIRDNWATVYAQAATPQLLSIATLQTAGYLGNGFGSGNNPLNQSHVIVIQQAGANQLTGAVLTTGGRAFSELSLRTVASLIGDYSGYVPYSTDPVGCSPTPCLKGVGAAWSLNLAAFSGSVNISSGHIGSGIYFTQGSAAAPYLYRYVSADPDGNTMHTSANWNGNNLTDAANISATTQVSAPTFADYSAPTVYYITPAGTSNVKELDATTLTATGTVSGNTVNATTSMTAPVYYHVSDARLKNIEGRVADACERLSRLDGVDYNWKRNGKAEMGVVAQQVADAFPRAVGRLPDGTLAVKSDELLAPLIECLRDSHLLPAAPAAAAAGPPPAGVGTESVDASQVETGADDVTERGDEPGTAPATAIERSPKLAPGPTGGHAPGAESRLFRAERIE